jgi:hypothetical protein
LNKNCEETCRLYRWISLYLAFTNELNVAQKEKNIDEWLILLKNIILLMKRQLVTSYTLKHDMYQVAEISSHGEYSYYGSVFIAFEIFPNHNYPGIVKLQYNAQ